MRAESYFAWLDQASPSEQLNCLISGGWIAQAIGVAAELGIADLLADGPKPSDELAQATGSHPRSLYRLLRMLASVGIFTESQPMTFGLTRMAELLRSHAPRSLRGRARFATSDVQWRAWGQLPYSVQTGQTAFEHVHGMDVWEYRARNPTAGAAFNAAMTSLSLQVAGAVVDAYDFGDQKVIVDVAGGHGALLMSILRANERLRGTVFDLPHVVEGTAQAIEAADLGDRCTAVAGDMFQQVPDGADLYILSNIVHDWDDERSVAILTRCREAMRPDSVLLLLEYVVLPGDTPSHGKLMDLNMLVAAGGQERTEEEYRALCAAAGLRLARVIPTGMSRDIIECVAAS
jgi:hypothetical protein